MSTSYRTATSVATSCKARCTLTLLARYRPYTEQPNMEKGEAYVSPDASRLGRLPGCALSGCMLKIGCDVLVCRPLPKRKPVAL